MLPNSKLLEAVDLVWIMLENNKSKFERGSSTIEKFELN